MFDACVFSQMMRPRCLLNNGTWYDPRKTLRRLRAARMLTDGCLLVVEQLLDSLLIPTISGEDGTETERDEMEIKAVRTLILLCLYRVAGPLFIPECTPRVYLAFNQEVPGTWLSCPVIIQSDELFARERDMCWMSAVMDVLVPPHQWWLYTACELGVRV